MLNAFKSDKRKIFGSATASVKLYNYKEVSFVIDCLLFNVSFSVILFSCTEISLCSDSLTGDGSDVL